MKYRQWVWHMKRMQYVPRCQGTTCRRGEQHQCKRAASAGLRMCHSHAYSKRYYIRTQCRRPDGPLPGADRQDWRSWRKFSVWPLLFESREAADEHLSKCFTFKGLHGRKQSACVCPTRRAFLRPEARIQ